MFKFILIAVILLNCSQIKNKPIQNFWVIWNIGQGQWVTHVTSDHCLHYDVGGEIGRFNSIKANLIKTCSDKRNHIFLSHWDTDHFIHIPQLARTFQNVCWQSQPPLNNKNNAYIRQITSLKIPFCKDPFLKTYPWKPKTGTSSNDLSWVQFESGFLLPGDSTKSAEKIWSKDFKIISQTKVLVLGHHGSRGSTSAALLNKLPKLQVAIASARKARYGHPHEEVLQRLRKNKTPVLKTEDWGSIWFL